MKGLRRACIACGKVTWRTQRPPPQPSPAPMLPVLQGAATVGAIPRELPDLPEARSDPVREIVRFQNIREDVEIHVVAQTAGCATRHRRFDFVEQAIQARFAIATHEAIAFEKTSGHSHPIKAAVGNFNSHNLRFEWQSVHL